MVLCEAGEVLVLYRFVLSSVPSGTRILPANFAFCGVTEHLRLGQGGWFAACALLAAAKEFPFNERINMRDQQKGKTIEEYETS